MIQPKTLGRFDRLVWFTAAVVLALIGVVIARGDQLQLHALTLSPAPQSSNISTRTLIRLQFDQPVAPLSLAMLALSPAISGTTKLNGETLTFSPATALQPNTTYTVTVAATLRGQQGGELREPIRWHFTTGGVRRIGPGAKYRCPNPTNQRQAEHLGFHRAADEQQRRLFGSQGGWHQRSIADRAE